PEEPARRARGRGEREPPHRSRAPLPPRLAVRGGREVDPPDSLDREGGPPHALPHAFLGEEDRARADAGGALPRSRVRGSLARGPPAPRRPGPLDPELLVHPVRRPDARPLHRPYPRRGLPRREGGDRPPGKEPPVQREPRRPPLERPRVLAARED